MAERKEKKNRKYICIFYFYGFRVRCSNDTFPHMESGIRMNLSMCLLSAFDHFNSVGFLMILLPKI